MRQEVHIRRVENVSILEMRIIRQSDSDDGVSGLTLGLNQEREAPIRSILRIRFKGNCMGK